MSSEDFTRLLKQDFSDLKAAGLAWQKLSTEMDAAFEDHRTRVTGPLHSKWEGEDARAALKYLEDIETRIQVTQTETMAIAKVIRTALERMEQAQKDLRAAINEAEAQGFPVDDDGVVSLPKEWQGTDRGALWGDEEYFDRTGVDTQATSFQLQIQDAVNHALKASNDAQEALAQLNGSILDQKNKQMAAESAKDVDKVMDHLGVKDPQIPKDPKAAAEWWKDLSPAQQQEYATLHPDLIGSTDGLPADIRNDANRLALEQEANRLQARDAMNFPGDEGVAEQRRNLEALRAALDKHDGASENKQLYLLDYDSAADGKAVIAMGNPDTADNVAVQVPGTSTTVAGTEGHVERIGVIQDAAQDADPTARTSVVHWLGYDAPEIPAKEAGNLDVAGPGRAEAGAQDLRDFTHGLRASHEGDRANLTVLGHSYGTTAVGAAASQDGGLDADNIVLLGSPGVTVDRAEDLNIDPEHVYVGLAEDDPIKDAQDLTLGPNVTSFLFGANRFETDTSGHSGYWDMVNDDTPSESLANQGRIIVGRQPSDYTAPTPIPQPPGHL